MPIPVNQLPTVATLNYSDLRPQIHSGDILLCSGMSLFSRLIQQATQSVWSHVAFIIRIEVINRVMVLESVEDIGVRTVPLSSYVRNYNGSGQGYPGKILIARHDDFKTASLTNLSQHAIDLLGYPYDKEEIARIASRLTAKAWNIQVPAQSVAQGHGFICSEYAYTCYESVGLSIDAEPEGFVAPADFAKTSAVNAINFLQVENPMQLSS